MVLAGVDLPDDAAHAGSVLSNDHEQVFGHEPHPFVCLDDLDVSEALPVGADLILTLRDEHAAIP